MPIPVGVALGTFLIDVSGTPFGGSPVWTDATADLLTTGDGGSPMSGSWGRQDYLGDITAAEATIILDNVTGNYTPGKTSGAYYPYIRKGLHVRVQLLVASVEVGIFDGYADSIEASFENGIYPICTLSCTDILGRFGNNQTLQGFLIEEMLRDDPVCLYPLQEAEGSTSFGDITGTLAPAVIVDSKYGPGVVVAGQDPSSGLFNSSCVDVTNTAYSTWTTGTVAAGSWLAVDLGSLIASGDYSIEIWAQTPLSPPAINSFIFSNAATAVSFQLGSAGTLNFEGVGIFASTPNLPLDGNFHQIVGTSNSTDRIIYIDGQMQADRPGSPGVGPSGLTTFGMDIGSIVAPGPDAPFTGAFAYIAVYPEALNAGRVLAHFNAGNNGFAGIDTTSQRIGRLASYRANTGVGTAACLGVMGEQDIASESLAQAYLDCGDVEGTMVYVDGFGSIQILSRLALFNPAFDLTLDCALQQVDIPTTFRDDNQNFRNDITVSRPGGADQRFVDQASVDQDGQAQDTVTIPIDTDANALYTAQWLVGLGTQEQVGSPALSVNLLTEPSSPLVLAALQIGPLDSINVINLPPAASSTFGPLVQGGSWTIGVEDFELSWYTTPLPPPVLTSDGIVNGISVAADTADSATYVCAY